MHSDIIQNIAVLINALFIACTFLLSIIISINFDDGVLIFLAAMSSAGAVISVINIIRIEKLK